MTDPYPNYNDARALVAIAFILLFLVVVAALASALLKDNAERARQDEMMSCINRDLGNCPDYSEVGREECFTNAVKRCNSLVYPERDAP